MAQIWEDRIPHFLNSVLYTPAGSIPKGAQWVVTFEDLNGRILKAIDLALSYERQQWKTASARDIILSQEYQKNKGCVFCQAIDLPGESMVVNPEGNIMSNAFLRSYVGAGRNQYPEMRMTFLETNLSFCENFLRPWAIATGAFGLVSRPKNDPKNYRTNMICYKLGTFKPGNIEVLMKMTFYDICCVSVSDESYDYQPVTGIPTMREARFIFNYYDIDTSKALSFQDNKNPNNRAALTASLETKQQLIKSTRNQLIQRGGWDNPYFTSTLINEKYKTSVDAITGTAVIANNTSLSSSYFTKFNTPIITTPSSTLKARDLTSPDLTLIGIQKPLTVGAALSTLGPGAKINLGDSIKLALGNIITTPSSTLKAIDLTSTENIKLDLNIK